MPEPQPSAEATSPKREHLMATAWRLFYRDGYRVVGIDTLLAEAQVAKMTLYNHFASKEDLIVAVIEKRSHESQGSFSATIDQAGRSPTRRLLAVFDWLKNWMASDTFNGCAFIRALAEYPDPAHPIHRAAWKHKRAINARIAELAESASAKKPAELADAISLLIDGAIIAAHASGSTAPAETARTAATALIKTATA